mgnify:CR=1 FL=1
MDINQQNAARLTKQMLESAVDCKCEKCQTKTFAPIFLIKKISALTSPSGQEMSLPIQTFACSSCGHINTEFVPK